jgi:predicted dehydrogenase
MAHFSDPSDIRVGIIGYSPAFNMGRAHMSEAQKAGMIPAAVADLNPDLLAAAEKDFPGIKTYSDGNDLINDPDIDLVVLIIPHNLHAEFTIKCLNNGKHVVSEKPFAITTEECDQMIAAARKNNRMVSTYHNRHWDGCILEALDRIRSGAIGDVVRIEAHMGGHKKPGEWWRSSKSISGGILYDWGVHLLEYSLQLLDDEIAEVMGMSFDGFWQKESVWERDTNEDEASAIVRMNGGSFINLRISSIDATPRDGQLEIFGTKGTYIMDQKSWKTVVYDGEEKLVSEGENREGERWRFYQNIADHLVKGDDLIISPEWARRPIHILDLAGRSSKEGRALSTTYR